MPHGIVRSIGWELYRSFLGVLEHGSLSGAARALGITQPTVGRHIASLEKALRVKLFTRSAQGLLPTDAARALEPYARTMQSTAAALERAAESQGSGIRGTVRLTASEVIGTEVLPAIVTALRRRHPDLKIELALSNEVQDLLRREADIAVRMTRPSQAQLLAQRIGRIELGLHATAGYLTERGMPPDAAGLAAHSLIGFDRPSAFVRGLLRGAVGALAGLRRELFALRSDSDLAQLALIRAGAGIGFCQVPLAARDATLVRVLPRAVSLSLDTYVTMHEDLRDSPRCRITFDALVEGLRRYRQPEK